MVRFTIAREEDDGDLTDYFRLYRETQGFDVNSAGRVLSGGIVQMGITCTESIKGASDDAKHALRSHNKYHKTDLEFVRYVKCNTQAVGGTMYYITFEARSPSLNQTNIYQAKVYTAFSGRKKVIIFRIKPPPAAHDKPSEKEAVTLGKKASAEKGPSSKKKKPATKRKANSVSKGRSSINKKEANSIPKVPRSRNKKPNEKDAHSPPKGAFLCLVNDLRKLPELGHLTRSQQVASLASRVWKSMSTEAKLKYYNTRNVQFEDVAQFLSLKMQKMSENMK